MSLLLALPDEVLLQIVGHLVPPLDGLDIPIGAYTNPDGVVVSNRAALYRLIFVCRRLSDIAVPFLYQTIYLWGQSRLQSLLQTLLEKPELGSSIRTLSFISCLGSDHYPSDVLQPYRRTNWRSLVNTSTCLPDRIKNFVDGAQSELEIAQVVFALILCSSPNLQSLHMRMPFSAGDYRKLKAILTPEIAPDTGNQPRILSSLTRVMLEPMPEYPEAMFWPRRELPCLFRLPSLRSVELGNAVFRPADLEPGDGWGDAGSWKNVEEVRLLRSNMWGPGWHTICSLCPNLRLLEMSPSGEPETAAGEFHLNDALPLVAETLKSFTFESISATKLWDHIGGDGTLSCLPKMNALQQVKLDIGILFKEPSRMEGIDIRHRLPKSLETLDLAELWIDVDMASLSDKTRSKYELDLRSMLQKVILESRKQLPNLREVTFRPNPFYRSATLPEDLTSGKGGVRFTVVY